MDLSPRARLALEEAELLFCEDTRKLRALAQSLGLTIKGRLVAIPGNEERDYDWAQVEKVQNVVLVSDAGTPVVNDPGFALIRYCSQAGVEIKAIPGPAAPILAWQWSGGFGLPFVFSGFVPKTKNAEAQELTDFFAPALLAKSFCFFDTRHQIETTLEHLSHSQFSGKVLFLAREMTKPFEELWRGTAAELLDRVRKKLATDNAIGEMTLLLEGNGEVSMATKLDLSLLVQIKKASTKDASKIIAKLTGLKASDCYDALVEND